MKSFVKMFVGMLIVIIIYLAMGSTLTLTTGELLPVVNSTKADYSMINGNFGRIHIIFPIIIVLFALSTVILYLLDAHRREYEEYKYR